MAFSSFEKTNFWKTIASSTLTFTTLLIFQLIRELKFIRFLGLLYINGIVPIARIIVNNRTVGISERVKF